MNIQSINQFTLYNLETNNLKPKIKFFKSNNNKPKYLLCTLTCLLYNLNIEDIFNKILFLLISLLKELDTLCQTTAFGIYKHCIPSNLALNDKSTSSQYMLNSSSKPFNLSIFQLCVNIQQPVI